jgi:hypothetical protein
VRNLHRSILLPNLKITNYFWVATRSKNPSAKQPAPPAKKKQKKKKKDHPKTSFSFPLCVITS